MQALARDSYSYLTNEKMPRKKKQTGKKNKKQNKQKKNMPAAKKRQIPRFKGNPVPIAPPISQQLVSSNRPVRTGFKATTNGMNAFAQGVELIGSITVNSGDAHGKILLEQNIAPQFLQDTRIQAFSQLFEKYKYDDAELILRSKCSNSTNGSAVAYFERDVSEPRPGQNPDTVKRKAQTWGAADVPIKMDGYAFMKKIPSENPYLTDLSGSQTSTSYGQAIAYVQLNSTGSSVVASGDLTVYDVLLKYRCRFWVPALQDPPLLFYTLTNPTGTGVTTSYFLATDMQFLEQGGTLPPLTYTPAAGDKIYFTIKYGHIYMGVFWMTGATILGLNFTPNVPSGSLTALRTVQSDASDTANCVVRYFKCTSTNIQVDQVCTITLSATTITTCSGAQFELFDFGTTFDPSNPVPAPMESSSKWLKNNLGGNYQTDQIESKGLLKQLQLMQCQIDNLTAQRKSKQVEEVEDDFEVPDNNNKTSTQYVCSGCGQSHLKCQCFKLRSNSPSKRS